MSEGQPEQAQLVRENEALRRQVAGLEAEAERFKTTLYSIGDAVISVDTDGNVLQMNPVAQSLTGWGEAEALGQPLAGVFRIVNEETRAEVESPADHVLREGVVVGLANHTLLIAKDGSERPIADSGAPIRNENSEITGVVLVFRDQTEERAAQKALHDSEVRFRNLFENSPLGTSMTEVAGGLRVNQAFASLLGYSEQDLCFKTWQEITHPDDVQESADIVQSLVNGEESKAHWEKRYIHKSGRVIWTDVTTAMQRDQHGKPLFLITMVSDITERKQAEAELRIKNQVFEDSIASQSIADEDGVITHVNAAFLRLWGYAAKEEAIGKSVGSFFANPVDATPVLEALGAHDAWDGEFLARRTDGTTFVSRGYATSLRNAAGELIGYQSTNLDVTREREGEVALRDSERKFRDIVRYLDEGYYSCDMQAILQEHNPAFNRIFGLDPDHSLRGSKMPDFWQNPDDRTRYLAELLTTGFVRNSLANVKTPRGDKLVVMVNAHLVRDENGNPSRLEGTFTDFTDRKRMEERISHLNLVLKAIRNVNQLIVREKDAQTLIRRSCEVLTETRGYFSAWIALYDESGKYLTAASAGLGDAFEALGNCLRGGQLAVCGNALHECGLHIVRDPAVECPNCPAATLYKSHSAIAVRLGHEGHVHGLLVISMDRDLVDHVEEQNLIEEVADDIAYALHGLKAEERRSAAEEELSKHRDELERRVRDRTAQLEESNNELEAFSYSVSHDLRAPLRAIDGFTRILTDDYAPQLDTEGKRICSVIHENTGKMSRLIDDLLAFSRLGRAEMSLSRIDMATMANSVFHELTTPESRERIDFQVGTVPQAVADPTLMRQVWMNLLSNAIKFSSKRERAVIKVSARASAAESIYAVQDAGAGFDMQYVDKLFGVFQRLHSAREFEGTGVGLALVQRVIRRHGGRVWAEGKTDQGATFYFALTKKGT